MVDRSSSITYELRCNDAFFGLVAEGIKLHSLRTRRLQSLRRLVEFCLTDELWRVVPYNSDDMRLLTKTIGTGSMVAYLSLESGAKDTLRSARNDVQVLLGTQLSNMAILAILIRLSLDV